MVEFREERYSSLSALALGIGPHLTLPQGLKSVRDPPGYVDGRGRKGTEGVSNGDWSGCTLASGMITSGSQVPYTEAGLE